MLLASGFVEIEVSRNSVDLSAVSTCIIWKFWKDRRTEMLISCIVLTEFGDMVRTAVGTPVMIDTLFGFVNEGIAHLAVT